MLLDIIQWEEGLNKIHVDPVVYTIVPELADPLHHRFPYIKRGNHPIIQIPVTIGRNIHVKIYVYYSKQFSFDSRTPKKLAIKYNQYFFLTISAMPVEAIVVSHSKCPTIATTMDTKGIRHSSIKDPKLLEPHYRPCIIQIMPRDRYNNNPQSTVVAELRHDNSINSNNLLVPVLTVTKVN